VITDGLMAENPHGDRLTSPSPLLALSWHSRRTPGCLLFAVQPTWRTYEYMP